ncbi:MAG: methylated-DNA--[protein]-cysteine S-methyltransferase, partial [Flavobacteriales bacterium]|nr:methylated-DNA--[protein]-cysteine S-methyltransferase [Flavobacteriales bacterium]
PKAYRALGNANAKNPVAILIPCHRVIKKNNAEGGYAWGIKRKSWLLAHESQFTY